MQPVGNLNDEKEFEQESHLNDGIVPPQGRNIEEESFTVNHISSPEDRTEVEDEQLSRLIEFAHLNFRQVKFGLDFL